MSIQTKRVWTPDIPINEIRVGDHVRVLVVCRKQRPGCNEPNRMMRNCTVTSIHGKILKLEHGSFKTLAVNIRDVEKAWGYR